MPSFRLIATTAVAALIASVANAAPPRSPAQAAQPLGDYGDLHWRLVGPFRGGWDTMVEGVPDRPDTFYFSGAGGGLWRTEDAGRTWVSLFDRGPAASVGA